jgi:hypothetical protein
LNKAKNTNVITYKICDLNQKIHNQEIIKEVTIIMNRNKNISELINLLEIQKYNVVEDSKKNGVKLNAIRDLLLKDEITIEDEVI